MIDLEPILEQVHVGDPVGAAYRLTQAFGTAADGRSFYEAGSLALSRRDELGDDALRFARIVFAEAVERDPALGEAHHDLATTMRELGMAQDAIPHYTKALDLMPGDVDSLIGLGAAQCDAGQLDDGVATLRRATEEHPESGHAFANLGVAWEAIGRDEEAAGAYAKAVARFDAAVAEASEEELAAEMAARRRWGRVQHAQLLERLERWPQAVVEYRRLYEEEQAVAEAEAEAEAEAQAAADGDGEEGEGEGGGEGEDVVAEAAALHGVDPAEHMHELDLNGEPEEETLVEEDDDEDDQPEGDADGNGEDELDAGRLGLERLFARFVQLSRLDMAYLVLDDLGGEIADQRTRATYTLYDAGDGLPAITVEHWDGGRRERLDPQRRK